MAMSVKYLFITLTAVLPFLLGLFVIWQRRTLPHITGFLICLTATLLPIFLLGREWSLDQNRVPLPWNNLFDGTLALHSLNVASFALTFPRPAPYARKVFVPFALFSLIVAGIAFGGGNFSGHRVIDHVHLFERTAFYDVYLIHSLSAVALTIGIFLGKYRSLRLTGSNERAQKALGIILGGFSIAIANGFFFSYVQPILLGEIRYFYMLSLSFLVGASVVFYAIVQYNAFDIETVVHKTLSWLFLSSGPVVASVWAGVWLKPRLEGAPAWQWAASIGGIGILIGLYFYVAQPLIDQLFDRRKYDLRKTSDGLIHDLAVLREVEPMAQGILDRVCQVLPVEGAVAMIFDRPQEGARGVAAREIEMTGLGRVPPETLERLKTGSMLETGPDTADYPDGGDTGQTWLRENGLALCLPLVQKGELIGALGFGRKRTLQRFSPRELAFLTQVASAATIAFSNSLLLERVRELDRLKTEFLTEVAHELRGPLFGVSTIAEGILAQETSDLPEDHRRLIENIRVAAIEMKELVENLLDLSKIEMGVMAFDLRAVDVGTVVRLAVDLASGAAAAKGLDLIVDIDEALPMIQADKGRIRQSVSNLLSNAVKYTDRGEIHLSCRRDGEGIRIMVEDTGRGMTEEEAKGVFERYRRGERVGEIEGSGLGLALTKGIVEAHGGTIEVESKEGVGSRFSFYLPAGGVEDSGRVGFRTTLAHSLIRRGKGFDEVPKAIPSGVLRGDNETLAVIDDSEVERDLLRSFLEANGYRVLTAADGGEGLELIRSSKPSLVITDLVMPGLSGPELCHLLKADPATAFIPVIMLTARNNLGDMVFGIQMGADDYIAKPCNLQELSLRIAALLRMRRIRADLEIAQNRLMEIELIAASTGTLVHAIKNPVMLIRNYVQWVRDSIGRSNQPSAVKGLAQIDSAAEAIARILQGLRRAHIDVPKPSAVHLPELLDACMRDVAGTAFSSPVYQVIRQYPEHVDPVEGDKDQLGMALTNLLANAIEAMPEGGTLNLRIDSDGSAGVQVEIEDSGSGIPEMFKNNLFKPFVTTKGEGTGLGLWTAKRIIEINHGGRLTIESTPGKGTTATIRIPTGHRKEVL
jgi:signal transduction histidine kinase